MELECSLPTAVFDPVGVFPTATLRRPADSDLANFFAKNPRLKTLIIEGEKPHHLEAIALQPLSPVFGDRRDFVTLTSSSENLSGLPDVFSETNSRQPC